MKPTIAFVNESTIATDDELNSIVGALQIQVSRDFAQTWGKDADLVFSGRPANAPKGAWIMAILDDSDQAAALGYHDITSNGQPLGKVFAKTDKQFGLSLSVTMSHETLEMLADPDINQVIFNQSTDTGGELYALEVCDAVEDDSLGYKVDGVLVSDFVLPTWFAPSLPSKGIRFDFLGHLHGHVPALLPGGYIGAFPIPNTQGWIQVEAQSQGKPGMRATGQPEHSRRKRRTKPAGERVRSTAI
jgi:hypothetical protein